MLHHLRRAVVVGDGLGLQLDNGAHTPLHETDIAMQGCDLHGAFSQCPFCGYDSRSRKAE